MRFLMYGAGSIGRGFIAPLFAQNGWEAVLVDIDRPLVDALNNSGGYTLCLVGMREQREWVSNIRAVDGGDESAVLREICACDCMATSLGAAALERVTPLLAQGIARRLEQNMAPLDILICENLQYAAHILEGWITNAMPDAYKSLWRGRCGLVECAIGRMVPTAQGNDPLHIRVEPYGFLPVDKDAFRGEIPRLPGLVAHSPFAFYEQRKLYLHNMGHALCAYCGSYAGYTGIAQAIHDPYIHLLTQSAMTESATMLSQKYTMDFGSVYAHAEDLLLRFANDALGDSCARVGRDPLRKLARDDRLAGAMHACRTQNIPPASISLGYAAALLQAAESENEARELAQRHGGLCAADCDLVMDFYTLFRQNAPLSLLFDHLQAVKRTLRGNMV